MAKDKRNYNVFFDLHSVAGIVISLGLFVIFFCGGFALIRQEIALWEKAKPVAETIHFDYDKAVKLIQGKGYDLTNADVYIRESELGDKVHVRIDYKQAGKPEKMKGKPTSFIIDPVTYEFTTYESIYSYGEFIYRLHFFSQLPYIGVYLAGLISVFFLFALVSGIVIHWEKMWKNFFLFRPEKKLKTLFTDTHTALGFIGLPFQAIYAISGSFLGLSILALLPATLMYDGDQKALMEDFRSNMQTYELADQQLENVPSIESFVLKAKELQPNIHFHEVILKTYANENMHVIVHGNGNDKRLISTANIAFKAKDYSITYNKTPEVFDVRDSGLGMIMMVLHFGNFAGISIKIAYFLLAMLTCFVIISGVLVWLEARTKKKITPNQARKNKLVERWYLGISYALIVITALSFSLTLYLNGELAAQRKQLLYIFFFVGWLILSILFYSIYDRAKLARISFLSSGILFLLPICIHSFLSNQYFYSENESVFGVNLFLLVSSLCCFLIAALIRSKKTV